MFNVIPLLEDIKDDLFAKIDDLKYQLRQFTVGEPISNYIYIDDLATFGEDGYVYNTKECLEQLLTSKVVQNHKIARQLFEEACNIQNINIGLLFKSLTGNSSNIFNSLTTIESVFDSTEAVNIIVESPNALMSISNNQTFLEGFCNSEIVAEAIKTNIDVFELIGKNASITRSFFDSFIMATTIFTSSVLKDFVNINDIWLHGLYSSPQGLNILVKTPSAFKLGMHSKRYASQLAVSLNDIKFWTRDVLGALSGANGLDIGNRYKDNSISDFDGFIFVETAYRGDHARNATLELKHGFSGNLEQFAYAYNTRDYSATASINSYAFRCLLGISYYSDAWGENHHNVNCTGIIKYTAK